MVDIITFGERHRFLGIIPLCVYAVVVTFRMMVKGK